MLRLSADETGVYIKAMLPFVFGHKPLKIPWSVISHLREKPALVSNRSPSFIKTVAASLTRRKYMKIGLRDHPDQNMVIYLAEEFNQFVPASVSRES